MSSNPALLPEQILAPWRPVLGKAGSAPGRLLWLSAHGGEPPSALEVDLSAGPQARITVLGSVDLSQRQPESPGFDLVVMGMPESGCALIPLFAAAWETAAADGRLCLVHRERLSSQESRTAAHERLLQLAARCGFDWVEHHAVAAGDPAWRHLDLFRRKDGLRWRVGDAGPRHRQALRALFRASFDQEISDELWHWKYGDGRGCGTVVWQGTRIVAHYGVISRRARFLGRDIRAWQVGDVMVEPSERAAFTKRGPFFLAGASCNDACLAFDPVHFIGVGFPSSRHMRLAERVGIYHDVGGIRELSWDLGSPRTRPRRGLQPLTPDAGTRVRRRVDRLAKRMCADFRHAILVVRDWQFLQQRYFAHPQIDYSLVLVTDRWGLRAHGLLVLNCTGETCELVDLVGPAKRMPALVAVARDLASQAGAVVLKAWLSEGFASLLDGTGARSVDTDIRVPNSCWAPGPKAEEVRERWWLTFGDTDFH